MTPVDLKNLIDTGGLAIALFCLFKIWGRLNEVTDRMFTYLEEGRKERHNLASQLTAVRLEKEQLQRTMDEKK